MSFRLSPLTEEQHAAADRFTEEIEVLFRRHLPQADDRTKEAILLLTQSIVCNRLEAAGFTKDDWVQWATSFWDHNTAHKDTN